MRVAECNGTCGESVCYAFAAQYKVVKGASEYDEDVVLCTTCWNKGLRMWINDKSDYIIGTKCPQGYREAMLYWDEDGNVTGRGRSDMTYPDVKQPEASRRPRFESWVGTGLPKAWAENMGFKGDQVADSVWPIVDNENCGPIADYPKPEQMLCWCPSMEKQAAVIAMLRKAAGVPENEDWLG